ncbi:MAG: transcription termination factor Rho [Armatimonadetes bacterium]|nr:transcription termination factor Rho [Armatimonadota bacterium]MDW8121591.1 transcription termination factor Rho [Armatimonadota bacterium]
MAESGTVSIPDYDLAELENKNLSELQEIARGLEIPSASRLKKQDLVRRILASIAERNGYSLKEGTLEITEEREPKGFLRVDSYLPSPEDAYVSQTQVRRFALRNGDGILGYVRPPKEGERFYSLLRIIAVNGEDPEKARQRPDFEKLTPVFPYERMRMERLGDNSSENITARMVDIVAPIGKGQRGLIVSPPKAGKTTLLKTIARSIERNHPECHIIVLLIDERPEEVTDFREAVNSEVAASTFDQPPENQLQVARLVLEKAKRLVEMGKDVVILLDSLTRLTRQSNLTVEPSGRTLTGGLDPAALRFPKRFFGAARKLREGGSLTIIATALVDTGSRMDDHIYEEFKGTGNLELHLDRRLQERRVFPAIDIQRSGTRREELLFTDAERDAIWKLRRALSQVDMVTATERLIDQLRRTRGNDEFFRMIVQQWR